MRWFLIVGLFVVMVPCVALGDEISDRLDNIERMLQQQEKRGKYQPDPYCRARVAALTISGTVCGNRYNLRDPKCLAAYQACTRGEL